MLWARVYSQQYTPDGQRHVLVKPDEYPDVVVGVQQKSPLEKHRHQLADHHTRRGGHGDTLMFYGRRWYRARGILHTQHGRCINRGKPQGPTLNQQHHRASCHQSHEQPSFRPNRRWGGINVTYGLVDARYRVTAAGLKCT